MHNLIPQLYETSAVGGLLTLIALPLWALIHWLWRWGGGPEREAEANSKRVDAWLAQQKADTDAMMKRFQGDDYD